MVQKYTLRSTSGHWDLLTSKDTSCLRALRSLGRWLPWFQLNPSYLSHRLWCMVASGEKVCALNSLVLNFTTSTFNRWYRSVAVDRGVEISPLCACKASRSLQFTLTALRSLCCWPRRDLYRYVEIPQPWSSMALFSLTLKSLQYFCLQGVL